MDSVMEATSPERSNLVGLTKIFPSEFSTNSSPFLIIVVGKVEGPRLIP